MPLPTPVGRQHEVLYLPARGHSVVLGTAGSGKTTIAILRAAYLSDTSTPHAGKTLLVTYNNTLVKYLRHIGGAELRDVTVETFHKFARGYLSATIGFPSGNSILSRGRRAIVAESVRTVVASTGASPLLERPTRFFAEEIRWIASHGIEDLATYNAAERVGRGGAYITRNDRPVVFEVFETYQSIRMQRGFPYDWEEVANAANRELSTDSSPRKYRHVVIDEGQDLTPQMLRSLVLAVPDDGSVTFFGDYAQQIYGSRMSWRDVGFTVRRVEEFAENYRNSAPIARLALAIGDMPYFRDIPDLVVPSSPRALGPKPALRRFTDEGTELRFVREYVRRQSPLRSVAVLFRKRADERLFDPALRESGRRLEKDMIGFHQGPGLYYGSYHAAKGLEFEVVVLPLCSSSRWPDREEVAAFGSDEAAASEGRLLYVGVTRTRSELVITYTGAPSSLLPTGRDLYQVSEST